MARTAAGARLSLDHRRRQLALRAAMLRDLVTLWRVVDVTDLRGSYDRFASAASLVVRARYADSAGLAAGYFSAFRLAEGITGTPTVVVPDPPSRELVRDVLRSNGIAGIVNARRAGRSVQAAAQNGLVRVTGSATSLALQGARSTLIDAVERDRARPRWQRITSSDPCAFCAMLASRGADYSSETSGGFEAHDHCSCMVEPVYSGSSLPATSLAFRERWSESTRGLSGDDALRAFRRTLEGRD